MLDNASQNQEKDKGNKKPKREYLIPREFAAIADEAWSNPLIFAGVGGFITVAVLFSLGEAARPIWHWSQVIAAMAAGILVSGGALAAGTLLGFLFGIPRAIADPSSTSGTDEKRTYQENT